MAGQYQDVVHVVDVNRQQFAKGDGRSRLFPFRADGIAVTPSVIRAVFVGDWQAAYSQMYPFERTNLLDHSFILTPARSWSPFYVDPSTVDATLQAPDGRRGLVQRMRLGDCVGGPGSNEGGVVNTNVAGLQPGVSYVGSIWVRATNPCAVRIGVGFTGNSTTLTATTEWQRVSSSAVVPVVGASLAMSFSVSLLDNASVDPDTEIQFTFAQLEQQFDDGALGRYIETNGAAASITDYRVSDGNLLTTDPVLNDAPIYWTGTGHWLESPGDRARPADDMLTGVTWSFDQSERLLSLLKSKQEWYTENHSEFWNGWNERIFKLKTANTFGIAVWAFILNVPLTALSLRDRFRYFAFGPTRENFTNSEGEPVNPTAGNFPPISQGGQVATPKEKIQALRLRYYALTSDCSINSINRMLTDVFEDEGLAYVVDNEDMTMEYVFTFPVSVGFRQSMLEYDLLPKPAGVAITITAP